ncbi:odorant receptor 13a [Sitodiplosis mosellana]|uniref:odorant receptor 13a n=1 Tax=Sitodiplosis mosellana TaxID=263140 RepID=UPI00244398AC|nr:odorant receptor 13a [Sitodiplosis mosellana]
MSLFNPLPNDSHDMFAFPSQCFMLKFNGAWPLKHDNDSRNIVDRLYLCWAYALIILIALTCYAQASFLIASWGDILIVTECGCTVFMGLHNLLRLIHLSLNRSSLKRLIATFVKDIWISKSTHPTISAECNAEMSILRYISSLQFVLICMYILLPLFELYGLEDGAEKPYPYRMLFPYNANPPLAYSITYFLTSLAGFGVVTNLFSEDSLFGFFTTHTCGRFRLLHERIAILMRSGQERALEKHPHLMAQNWSQIRNAVIQREYREHLIRIINDHRTLISFFEELHDFFSPILLINYIISSLLICMVGLQIVAVELTIADLLKLVVYIVSALSQLFILCWKGNDIILHSVQTADSLYSCDWQGKSSDENSDRYGKQYAKPTRFDFPCGVEVMKSIKFTIKRAQKPLTLMAMKFSALALHTFTRILSSSISYFTLLQTLVERST